MLSNPWETRVKDGNSNPAICGAGVAKVVAGISSNCEVLMSIHPADGLLTRRVQ